MKRVIGMWSILPNLNFLILPFSKGDLCFPSGLLHFDLQLWPSPLLPLAYYKSQRFYIFFTPQRCQCPTILTRRQVLSVLLLELGSLVGATGGVSITVGVGTDASELSVLRDQILVAERLVLEVALQDLLDATGISRLRGQSRTGSVGSHRMPRHRAPGVVLY